MKQFHTVVLERMAFFTTDFSTEPYECGWASEALFFIRFHDVIGTEVSQESIVQVSVDGINWIDEGTYFPILTDTGDFFVKVKHFGGWLRLKNCINGKESSIKQTIHLVLKE
jgi:hypothetical protein